MKEISIKKPQQQRSKAKFSAITEALPHIIAIKGFEKTTTAAIALEADVSIGSLYDYFSCKEAILIAYLDSQLNDALNNVAYYAKHSALDWQDILKELVRSGIEFAHIHKPLLFILFTQLPALLNQVNLSDSKEKITNIAMDFTANTQLEISHGNIELMIYSLTNIILGFQFRIVLMNDESFDQDIVTDELTKIIQNYILPTIKH